jgi:DNA-binding SARP family transcriptional activator/predicted ATPase
VTLRVHVLGPAEVVVDGERRPLGGGIPRAVIALLALAQGRTVDDDVLLDTAWSGAPPASGRHALNVYVSSLRKILAPAATINRTPQGFTLTPTEGSTIQIDVAEFAELAEAARDTQTRGDLAAAGEIADRALALWRGRPFADLPESDEWAIEASRLDTLHTELLQTRAESRVAAGDISAIAELRAFAEDDPYDEPTHMRLMRALYLAGRQHDALDVFSTFARRARSELGLEPSAAMVALERAVLNHRLGVGGRSGRPRRSETVFGREELVAHVTSLLTDRARVVALIGIGGIGKTTTAIRVADELAEQGQVITWIAADDLSTGDAPSRIAEELTGLRNADPYNIDLDRDRPRLLVVDAFENHESEAGYLDYLVGAFESMRVLLTSRRPTRVSAEWIVQVPSLDASAAEALFTELVERRDRAALDEAGAATAAVTICRQVAGIPLALELAAARVGVFSIDELAETLDVASLAGGEAHRSMSRVLDSTVSLLTTIARRTLQFAGVFRSSFTLADLAAVAELPEPQVEAGLRELYDAGLILRNRDLDGSTGFFLLDPIRDYAAELLRSEGAAEVAKSRHLELMVHRITDLADAWAAAAIPFQAFARFDDMRPDLAAALEYALAEDRATEAVDLVHGALYLWGSLSNREAIGWVDRVRTLDLEPADRIRVLRANRTFLHNAGHLDAAHEISLEILASGAATLLDRVHHAGLYADASDLGPAIEQFEAITAEAREARDGAVLIRSLACLSSAYLTDGNIEAALANGNAAGEAIEEFDTGPLHRAYVRVHQAAPLIAVGDFRAAAVYLREALTLFDVGDTNQAPLALFLAGNLAISRGDSARGIAIVATANDAHTSAGMDLSVEQLAAYSGISADQLASVPVELSLSEAIEQAHAVLDEILAE